MDGVVPVVIMIRGAAVPAPVFWFERVMRPALPGVEVADDDTGAVEAKGPDRGSVDVSHAPFDRVHLRRRESFFADYRILYPACRRVGVYLPHIGARGESVNERAICRRDNHVGGPERLVAGAVRPQKFP